MVRMAKVRLRIVIRGEEEKVKEAIGFVVPVLCGGFPADVKMDEKGNAHVKLKGG